MREDKSPFLKVMGAIAIAVIILVVALFASEGASSIVPSATHADCSIALDCTIMVSNPTSQAFNVLGGGVITIGGMTYLGTCSGSPVPARGSGTVTCQFAQDQQSCAVCTSGASVSGRIFYDNSNALLFATTISG